MEKNPFSTIFISKIFFILETEVVVKLKFLVKKNNFYNKKHNKNST
jgi:hypothetical protein